jgi:hypothetical protein
MSSNAPIALWETARGMISAVDFSQDGEWIAIANYDGVIKGVDMLLRWWTFRVVNALRR